MRRFLFAILILSASVMSVGCSTNKASDNGLKIGDVAGKWYVTDIYNLYLTDSWDNIENTLGDDYIYAVFNNDYTYSGKFNDDLFTGTFVLENWNVKVTTAKPTVIPKAGDSPETPEKDPDQVTITYAMSDFKRVDEIMTAEIDITFSDAESGTMTVKVKKAE